ncbi:hypothetical protein HPP92_005887 [Vanilla planifolia]|uniref:Uncharacterized protein n=1 Tax=Vanilla planifolia TaxID=51239 RepID=A0A835V9H3_VANPL|nr:hypothetical protein HPP92_005887 [Vanilla planifolia]
MSPYSGEEAFDVLYSEIEELIKLVISDEQDEGSWETGRVPLRPVKGNRAQIYPKAFVDANWDGSSENRAATRNREVYGGRSGEWGKSDPSRGRATRTAEAVAGRGTGVFIPKSAAYGGRAFGNRH